MALATVRPCHGHGAINYLNNVYFKLTDDKKKKKHAAIFCNRRTHDQSIIVIYCKFSNNIQQGSMLWN